MQRAFIMFVCLMSVLAGADASRRLVQADSAKAVILLTRVGGRACTATVVLTTTDGSPLSGATVTYQWAGTAAAKQATASASGRFSVMRNLSADEKSCSLQLVGITSSSGFPVALIDASRAPRTVTWS